MFKIKSKQFLNIGIFTTLVSFTSFSHAHDQIATMGESANFTGYALVNCPVDGNGTPDYLELSVIDLSPPVPGLLVNMQIIKDDSSFAASTTDPISGDGNGAENASPTIRVHGGPGMYHILVNKTNVGARTFQVLYHCKTMDGIHTETNITVKQFQ